MFPDNFFTRFVQRWEAHEKTLHTFFSRFILTFFPFLLFGLGDRRDEWGSSGEFWKEMFHQESVFTIRTSAKNWMKTAKKENQKKLRNRRRISVSKAFHLQFTHTKVLRWLALKCGNWMVSSIVQSAFNFALITHRCRVWHWVSLFRRSRSREKGQESDQNRAL